MVRRLRGMIRRNGKLSIPGDCAHLNGINNRRYRKASLTSVTERKATRPHDVMAGF